MSESERESGQRRFVVDTNVFVSAISPFTKRGRTTRARTGSLALLIRLIADTNLQLFGDPWLLDEYRRLAEELKSATSELILGQLTAKTQKVTEVRDEAVELCKPYLPEREVADLLHAATCLQSKAVLITNDRDFDRISESGIIKVWGISKAMKQILSDGPPGEKRMLGADSLKAVRLSDRDHDEFQRWPRSSRLSEAVPSVAPLQRPELSPAPTRRQLYKFIYLLTYATHRCSK